MFQVNTNGDLTFRAAFSAYIPQSFPIDDLELIAPFWADSDTSPADGGDVWYRENDNMNLLQRAQEMIRSSFLSQANFVPTSLFIATWDHVGYYRQHTDKVSYLNVTRVAEIAILAIID